MKNVVRAADAEVYEAPEPYRRTLSILIDKTKGGAENIVMGLGELKPGSKSSAHSHENAEEVYWILKGKGFAIVGSEEYEISPDVAIFVPKKTLHQVRCAGSQPLSWIWVMAPASDVPESIRKLKRVR